MSIRIAALLLAIVTAGAGGCARQETQASPVADPPQGQPALWLTLGDGVPRHAALLQQQGARRIWRSADGIAVQTDGPRVIATAGLPAVVMATRLDGADPLASPEALLAREAPTLRLVDLGTADRSPAGMRFGVEIACRLTATVPDGAPHVLEVREDCRGPDDVGAFVNRFTLRRGDAALVGSVQWIGPRVPPLSTGPIPGPGIETAGEARRTG